MDRRERGPVISTRSDSLPSGTRQVQAFVVAPKGLSEAFFLCAPGMARSARTALSTGERKRTGK